MTFKELKKRISLEQSSQQRTNLFDILYSKPFWIWDKDMHKMKDIKTKGNCCFNHIVGLPQKNGIEKPIFDYEKLLYDNLSVPDLNHDFKNKHLWVKKATGIGVTEFMLRMMAWLCTRNNSFQNSQMCIITGPNIDIAIKLIKRLKEIFEKSNITFQNKETVLELNGCTIEAYPSNHLDSYRALENPKFILIDEADFFRKSEQDDVRDVSERYIGKSDPYIVMVSTPNAPRGLFEKIEKEPENTCIYKRIKLDYTNGLDRIYTSEEIEKAKKSPSFEREYNLKYLGLIGNVFHTQDIDNAICEYNPDDWKTNSYSRASMGIDCGFGSSAFGIVVTRLVDNKIQIVFADEFERPDYNEMLVKIWDLDKNYHVNNIYVDGANPEFIQSLKSKIGELSDPVYYNQYIEQYRKNKINIENCMKVVPVHFAREHRTMLTHCKMFLERGDLQIDPRFDKLIISLRTAVENGEGVLDKPATSFDDVFDAFRLAMKYYEFQE